MKCAKEIKAAAKVGGPNPEANPRLKAAIDRALQSNLSRDSIQRNITGANKDADNLHEVSYEGYGPNGLAIVIQALTDNEARTLSNVRGYFSKLHGELSKRGSVSMLFNKYGQFFIDKSKSDEDAILSATMDCKVIDIKTLDDVYELLVEPEDYFKAKQALEDAGIPIFASDVKLISETTVALGDEDVERLERFTDACEDDDDIQ